MPEASSCSASALRDAFECDIRTRTGPNSKAASARSTSSNRSPARPLAGMNGRTTHGVRMGEGEGGRVYLSYHSRRAGARESNAAGRRGCQSHLHHASQTKRTKLQQEQRQQCAPGAPPWLQVSSPVRRWATGCFTRAASFALAAHHMVLKRSQNGSFFRELGVRG